MLPGCSKSYGRVYDLERHLVSKHGDALCDADDVVLLSAGVSHTLLTSLRSKLGKRFVCAACSKGFSRSDALSRHMDEQGHRPIVSSELSTTSASQHSAPLSAPAGYSWQLVPDSDVPAPPAPVRVPVQAQAMDWSALLLGSTVPISEQAYHYEPPTPAMDWSHDPVLDPLQPSAPTLADLHNFPPLPVLDGASQFALFPNDAVFAEILDFCADVPPPSESEIDRALNEWRQSILA